MTLSIEEVVTKVADWEGKNIQIHKLRGGLTNHNYRVNVDGTDYFVRVPGADSEMLAIDRRNEYQNSMIASRSGVAPKVLYHLKSENVMIQEFIHGKSVSISDTQSEEAIGKITDSLKKLHRGPGLVNVFNMFRVMDGYLEIILERKMKISEGYLEEGAAAAKKIEFAINKHPQPLTACHNDTWPENLIDDGSKYYLIDFELSGNNDIFFDLGNAAVECQYNDEQVRFLCQSYFGESEAAKVARIQLYSMMSDLGWVGWTLIQHEISSVDFDYWEFANFRWERVRKKIHSERFPMWLDEVSRHA